jgi:hypothetical protein
MDSLSLLAEASSGNVRARSLRTDDDAYALLVRVHDEPGGTLLQLRAWLNEFGFFHVVVDDEGCLVTSAVAETDGKATELVRRRLRDEHGIELTTPGYHLLADHPNGSRRRAVLHTDDDRLSARAKVYFDEDGDETLLRVRLFVDGFGAIQLVLSDRGRIKALLTGRTDSDAYDRVRGELARKGIELE